MRDVNRYWNGGAENALAERVDERTLVHGRILQDHEDRLRKVETRLQRGAILAVLMGSGIAGNLSKDQIVDIVVRLLKGG